MDQRTFAPAGAAPSAGALAGASLPQRPLVTITLAVPDVDWRPSVAGAVQAAQARKPDAAFDVVTPIPTSAPPAVQEQYSAQGRADARMVADALQANGVSPDHISLRFQGDPGAPAREVLIYAH